ncbi:hypothetical protein [Cellulomonas sp. Leaf395]|uniref:hypothetical protein n=1 Tax=Cellulomonas sp. Leaf395 TaxID=1736362 RepID=UPI000AC77CFC
MPRRHVQLHARPPQEAQGEAVDVLVRRGLAALRVELGVPEEFPAHVLDEAKAAAAGVPEGERSDATDIPFVTIDPEGSKDRDQAVHIERRDDGFRVVWASRVWPRPRQPPPSGIRPSFLTSTWASSPGRVR